MKILLIAPSQSKIYGNFQPPSYPALSLGYLGAVLEKSGHEVRIADIDADRITEDSFAKALKREDYKLVGITTTTPTFSKAIYLSRLIKHNSKAFTVLGGIHATIMPEEAMKFDSVDFVISGEGEKTMVELASFLEGNIELELVDGLYYRQNGKVSKNRDRELIPDLDSLPYPARHLFNQQNYTYPDTLFKATFPIMTSRGCPANCTYCNARSIFGRKFRFRSAQNVVDEVEYLIEKFKAKEIHIWDDNFTVKKDRVFQIRDEIKRRNIKIKFAFPNGLRVDSVNESILKALKDMGTYSVAFGVESGDQRILDRIKKNIRLEQVERAFKLAKKVKIETWAFFMLGLPGEDEESIKNTINFAKKIDPDVVKFHILKPFPGTEVYNDFLEQGLILDRNFDNYGIHTPPVHRLPNLSAEDILEWQKQAYQKFYFRPSILLEQMLRLKSFNRIKLNVLAAKNFLKSIK